MTEQMSDLMTTDRLLTALAERRPVESDDPVVTALADLVRQIDAEPVHVVTAPSQHSPAPFMRRAGVALAAAGVIAVSSSGLAAAAIGDPLMPIRYVVGKLYEHARGDDQPDPNRLLLGQGSDATRPGGDEGQAIYGVPPGARDHQAGASDPARMAGERALPGGVPRGSAEQEPGSTDPVDAADDVSAGTGPQASQVPTDPGTPPPANPAPTSPTPAPESTSDVPADGESSPDPPSESEPPSSPEEGDVPVDPDAEPAPEDATEQNGRSRTGHGRPDAPGKSDPRPHGGGETDPTRSDGRPVVSQGQEQGPESAAQDPTSTSGDGTLLPLP